MATDSPLRHIQGKSTAEAASSRQALSAHCLGRQAPLDAAACETMLAKALEEEMPAGPREGYRPLVRVPGVADEEGGAGLGDFDALVAGVAVGGLSPQQGSGLRSLVGGHALRLLGCLADQGH